MILLDENLLLFEQNNERNTRKSIKATVVSSIKIMSYKDIVEVQKQYNMKEASGDKVQGKGRRQYRGWPKYISLTQVLRK